MRAYIAKSRAQYVTALVFVALIALGARHVLEIAHAGSFWGYLYEHWVFLFSFIMLAAAIVLAYSEKALHAKSDTPDNLHVTVVVPAYNEDPELLKECLGSLINQSRLPQEVYVTDDGSTTSDYAEIRDWFGREAAKRGVEAHWTRKPNGGKRSAQAVAFGADERADVFVTVDSDSVLDYEAMRELLNPFDDPEVQSVAGVVLARNNRTNVLARLTDLLFVTGQLIDRSMMSHLGSVLVNSGGLAAYRSAVVRGNLEAYLHEDFFGSHIEFSDDSMLTLYALARGKTVQQPTAFVFTMMPDRLNHHLRQQIRWMKGSFIRSWWRIRYLPMNSYGFMRQAYGAVQFVMTSAFLVALFVLTPTLNTSLIPYIVLAPIVFGYAQALRYFSVKRSDESLRSQLLTYALAPIALLWTYFVLRPVRIYAAFTCVKAGWGTRGSVEVTLQQMHRRNLAWRMATCEVVRETEYEVLLRAIRQLELPTPDAEATWLAHYHLMTDAGKRTLWREYERVLSRRAWVQETERKLLVVPQRVRPRLRIMRRVLPQAT